MNGIQAATIATLLAAAPALAGEPAARDGQPGEAGVEQGLAIRAAKALAVPLEGTQVIDNAVVLVRDGRIEAIGAARSTPIPAGYEVLDVGRRWIAPGLVDLHTHVAGGLGDLNDMVYLTNPGLRASSTITPGNDYVRRAIAGGVTSVLLIPGSGTNMGGQGVLVKLGFDTYEANEIRDPGSLKLAQAGNPEGYLFGVGRSFMNWNTRNTFRRGVAYAKRWERYEQEGGQKPEVDLQLEIFRKLYRRETQVSVHTQIYQVVNATLSLVAQEMGLPVFIDHGTFDGWRAAARAQELKVPAILGPRNIDVPTRMFIQWSGSNPERIQGVAAGYQELGHTMIGFNTDAPVIPSEELFLQASMAVRYGFRYENLETVRGLTIVPAVTAGIDRRLGSLEVGKDADIVVFDGDPADPRRAVELVLVEGRRAYDPKVHGRRF